MIPKYKGYIKVEIGFSGPYNRLNCSNSSCNSGGKSDRETLYIDKSIGGADADFFYG